LRRRLVGELGRGRLDGLARLVRHDASQPDHGEEDARDQDTGQQAEPEHLQQTASIAHGPRVRIRGVTCGLATAWRRPVTSRIGGYRTYLSRNIVDTCG